MNETQVAKIQQFLNDHIMSDIVWGVIEAECLKSSKDRDVQSLAARFLAIEILNGAWRELEKYQSSESKEGRTLTQVGL